MAYPKVPGMSHYRYMQLLLLLVVVVFFELARFQVYATGQALQRLKEVLLEFFLIAFKTIRLFPEFQGHLGNGTLEASISFSEIIIIKKITSSHNKGVRRVGDPSHVFNSHRLPH